MIDLLAERSHDTARLIWFLKAKHLKFLFASNFSSGLEKSTSPLAMVSAVCCRTSRNLDCFKR